MIKTKKASSNSEKVAKISSIQTKWKSKNKKKFPLVIHKKNQFINYWKRKFPSCQFNISLKNIKVPSFNSIEFKKIKFPCFKLNTNVEYKIFPPSKQ